MEGAKHRSSRRRDADDGQSPSRPVVVCRPGVLGRLFAAEGIKTYSEMSEALGYGSAGGIHRALHEAPVSAWFISAVRLRFPEIPYERIFTERVAITDAPAHAAA